MKEHKELTLAILLPMVVGLILVYLMHSDLKDRNQCKVTCHPEPFDRVGSECWCTPWDGPARKVNTDD